MRTGAWEAGADLVIGQGPHVLGVMETCRKKLIAYSLGNFLTYGMFNLKGPNGTGAILLVRIDTKTGEFLSGRIVLVTLYPAGLPVIDYEQNPVSLVQSLAAEDFGPKAIHIGEQGNYLQSDRSGWFRPPDPPPFAAGRRGYATLVTPSPENSYVLLPLGIVDPQLTLTCFVNRLAYSSSNVLIGCGNVDPPLLLQDGDNPFEGAVFLFNLLRVSKYIENLILVLHHKAALEKDSSSFVVVLYSPACGARDLCRIFDLFIRPFKDAAPKKNPATATH
ncbi:MAG TPA: hypothetical protein DCR97_01530 [Deltaproteobacteria bacterium]|nr:hypothetical protein [Deltaproteobacteria bacterium]